MNPLGITDRKFNYEWLLKAIEALYGEGRSKYSDEEKEEVDKLREISLSYFRFFPPHISFINNTTFSRGSETFKFNQKNLDILMELLYKFETMVKDYNDEHGLTTKNKGTSGLF